MNRVNYSALCRKYKINYNTFIWRIKRKGMSVEEASSIPAWGITGKKYKGVCLWRYCKEHNIKYNRVRSRLLSGWTMEDAVNKPLQKEIEK